MTPLSARRTSAHNRRRRLAFGGVLGALVLVLAGCGGQDDDSPSSAQDRSSASATTDSVEPSESPGADDSVTESSTRLDVGDQVKPGHTVIVSASNVDGAIMPLASALPDETSIDAFVDSLDPQLGADVREAIAAAQVPAGSTLFGSVVAVGCEEPVAVEVASTFDGLEATGVMPKSGVQCLVPVTSVALFAYED